MQQNTLVNKKSFAIQSGLSWKSALKNHPIQRLDTFVESWQPDSKPNNASNLAYTLDFALFEKLVIKKLILI